MFLKQGLSLLLSGCLLLISAPGALAQADQSAAQPPVQDAPQTPEQLQQLVAPIALYPDALVAQILAAATYPDQVVEADRWLQQHTDLKGEQLGKEVDKQPWDPSVKALVQACSLTVPELRLASALESASLADLAGDGNTGDTIGITMGSSSTTAPISLTAECSSVATTSIAPAGSRVVASPGTEVSPHRATASRPAPTPAHSAASIMEESQEAFLFEGSRASVEVSEAEVFTEAEAVAGNSFHYYKWH
jgi:hypothetical protein